MSDEIIPITRPSSAGPQQPVFVKPETQYPTEAVELPSKGYFYSPDDPETTWPRFLETILFYRHGSNSHWHSCNVQCQSSWPVACLPFHS